ncbi:MAG: TIGR01212 family radical SAM protein [Deltaproteobacteria bacterium]|nr:TIGR01212 family radical SAM protein [Deltaproteobacteria bacterium]
MTKRYNDFNTYLRRKFGCRVQKITIDAGFSCPNRDGTLSGVGCLYCDEKGSGSGAANRGQSIEEQIYEGKLRLASRYKAKKFLAYFQAFTNTYAGCGELRKKYDEAITDPDVVGLAIGTRPDCVDEEKLELIQGYTATHMVWMEYGLQSAHNRTLKRVNRGHSVEDFIRAVHLTQGRNILICAHVILGLPGESSRDIVKTATTIANLGIEAVKIHNLYIVKDTPMAQIYNTGKCAILDQERYVDWITLFLEHLRPDTIIQRLTGDPNRHFLLAPRWALEKHQTLAMIHQNLQDRNTFQGRLYKGACCEPVGS